MSFQKIMELAIRFEQKIALAEMTASKAYQIGFEAGEYDLKNDEASDILSSFMATYELAGHPDEDVWLAYAHGYAKGAKFDDRVKSYEFKRMIDAYGRQEQDM